MNVADLPVLSLESCILPVFLLEFDGANPVFCRIFKQKRQCCPIVLL